MSRSADRYFRAQLAQQAEAENRKQARYDTVWNDYMSEYGNLGGNIDTKNKKLEDAFNSFFSSLNDTTGQYTGAIAGLADKLNSPESKVTFGLEGFDPITSTKRSAREDVGTLSDLAKSIYAANLVPAEQKYNYDQTAANSVLDHYNALLQAAQTQQGGDQNGVVNAYSGWKGATEGSGGKTGALGSIGAISSLLGSTGQGAAGISKLLSALGYGAKAGGTVAGAGAGLGAGASALWAGGDAALSGLAAGAGEAGAAAGPALLALAV